MTNKRGEHHLTRNMDMTAPLTQGRAVKNQPKTPRNQEPGTCKKDQEHSWRQRGHQDSSTSTNLSRAPGPSIPPPRTKEPAAESQEPEQGLIAGAMTQEPPRMPQRRVPGSQEQEQET